MHDWHFDLNVRTKPVEDAYESSEESYQEAEVAVTPDPDGEGQEHDPNVGDVGEAVKEDHPVYQGVLLDFEPDKDYNVDEKDCESVCNEGKKIKNGHFPIRINMNCIFQVKR